MPYFFKVTVPNVERRWQFGSLCILLSVSYMRVYISHLSLCSVLYELLFSK